MTPFVWAFACLSVRKRARLRYFNSGPFARIVFNSLDEWNPVRRINLRGMPYHLE